MALFLPPAVVTPRSSAAAALLMGTLHLRNPASTAFATVAVVATTLDLSATLRLSSLALSASLRAATVALAMAAASLCAMTHCVKSSTC
jgi:hypothetical protein